MKGDQGSNYQEGGLKPRRPMSNQECQGAQDRGVQYQAGLGANDQVDQRANNQEAQD